ncbi:hypothetical protein VH441_03865 [Psychrobacter sp. HD31]|uniref:hypothetical protein n=1 Tax=Psychrobacter sp. HD31 TaxID=3112003 RepID=UPI003DA30514
MKKLLCLSMLSLAMAACSNNATTEETKVEEAKSAMPETCQAYISAVEKLVEKLVEKSPEAGKQFEESIAASKAQWENLSDAQVEEVNNACKQMMEQI